MLWSRDGVRERLRGVAVLAALLTGGLTAAPPPASADGAAYSFEQTQSGRSAEPVGWNPCRTIPVRVNLRGAPRHSMQLVRQALADVAAATGDRLVLAGRSHRTSGFLHHYGVLVSWTTPRHQHALAGGVVGIGATSWRQISGGPRHYVRGAATLDGPALRRMDAAKQLAVLEHELGHVMGLGHVRDPQQLMYPKIHGQRGFQAGDRAGLAVLGHLPCS